MNTQFDPELSRLAFEDRLLEFCEDDLIPLLERVRLLGIFGERMDVFFMTRVGRLKRLAAHGEQKRAAPVPPDEQLDRIAPEATRMMARAYRLLDELLRQLRPAGVGIERCATLDAADREHLRERCTSRLADTVHLSVVDPAAGFPHVRNLRPALIADATRRLDGSPCLVIAELPAELPRLVPLARGHRFVALEDVLAAELPSLCRDLAIGGTHLFRVTRNASTEIDDDDDVLRDFVQEIVRRPFQEVVRLEVERGLPAPLRERLLHAWRCEPETDDVGLTGQDTYVVPGLLDLTALEAIADLELPSLRCAPMARRPARFEGMLDGAREDALLHFPFDDYETSIERFLHDAARHPALESIQTTIYRTDEQSDVVAALLAARARGAGVDAVVELKASFDERENIALTRVLEEAGVRVVLSPVSLKVHAKAALVTLRHGATRRRVALIGTGNMNALTARSYVDLWLATGDDTRTGEVAALFQVLTGERPPDVRFERLLVAPFEMRRRFLELIEREGEHATAGRPAAIRAMMNGLTDPTIIAALHRASQAGVAIDLMVRGVCLLRPGVPEISDTIRIVSLAGQLLQHARIFHFRNGGDDRWFIGSADWRPRNFDARVELIADVPDPRHQARLDRILSDTLAASDAWILGADGVYRRRSAGAAAPCAQGIQTYVTLTPS